MAHVKQTVVIHRPVADVFAFVSDGENDPKWRSGVIEIKRESGQGAGAVYRQSVKGPLGRSVAADYEVTAFEPDKLLAFQAIAGPVRPRGRYDFDATDEGTRLTFSLDVELSGAKKLMGRSVEKSMQAEMQALENLKRVLEAG